MSPLSVLMSVIELKLRASNVKLVSLACGLFCVLMVTRYVDLFDSLLARGLVFLLLGVGLFVVGNFYSRMRRLEPAASS